VEHISAAQINEWAEAGTNFAAPAK
jgi:hypothetical protein